MLYIYILYIYIYTNQSSHSIYIYMDESSHVLQQTNSKLISIDALKKTFKICRCFSNCQTWLYIVIHMIDGLR